MPDEKGPASYFPSIEKKYGRPISHCMELIHNNAEQIFSLYTGGPTKLSNPRTVSTPRLSNASGPRGSPYEVVAFSS